MLLVFMGAPVPLKRKLYSRIESITIKTMTVNRSVATHGAARQARTRRTRAAVVDSARQLFMERGYAATTIEVISERSDTPQATVYRLFSSKLGILKSLLDVLIGGDDQAVGMLDRPQVRVLLTDENQPHNQLAAFTALVREVLARVGPVQRILADAARSDPDAAKLLADIARQRHVGQRRIAQSLARGGALRTGLRERDAADILHALASPEVYGLLVLDRGWSGERYETWLTAILSNQLLAHANVTPAVMRQRPTERDPTQSSLRS